MMSGLTLYLSGFLASGPITRAGERNLLPVGLLPEALESAFHCRVPSFCNGLEITGRRLCGRVLCKNFSCCRLLEYLCKQEESCCLPWSSHNFPLQTALFVHWMLFTPAPTPSDQDQKESKGTYKKPFRKTGTPTGLPLLLYVPLRLLLFNCLINWYCRQFNMTTICMLFTSNSSV